MDDQVELLDLGEAVDQRADLGAEQIGRSRAGGVGVLDGVVQQRGDGGVVELQVGEDGGDFERMGEIGIAGGARLIAMRSHGIDIGAVEQRLVGIRVVAADPLDQLVLTHHDRVPVAGAPRRAANLILARVEQAAGAISPRGARRLLR